MNLLVDKFLLTTQLKLLAKNWSKKEEEEEEEEEDEEDKEEEEGEEK